MNFETKTYRMKVQTFPILGGPLERPSGAGPELAARGEAASNLGVSYFSESGFGASNFGICGFLAWLQLWVAALANRSLMSVFARDEGAGPPRLSTPAFAFTRSGPRGLCPAYYGQSANTADFSTGPAAFTSLCRFASFKCAAFKHWAIYGTGVQALSLKPYCGLPPERA